MDKNSKFLLIANITRFCLWLEFGLIEQKQQTVVTIQRCLNLRSWNYSEKQWYWKGTQMLTKSLQQGKQTNEQTKKLLFRWVEIKTSQQNIQKQYSPPVGMDDEL